MSIISAGTSNTTSLIYTGDTTGNLMFQTNGTTEAMRIDTNGFVGINTANTLHPLTVKATGNFSGNAIRVNTTLSPSSYYVDLKIQNDGTVGGLLSSSTYMAFQTAGVERIRIPSDAGGITFPATQAASSDPNTLDDYEEGTWTPTAAVAGRSSTWSTKQGRYIKIGKVVHCWAMCDGGSSGATDTYSVLFSLPFTPGQGYNNQTGGIWSINTSGSSVKNGNIMIQNGDTTALIMVGGGHMPYEFGYFSAYFSYVASA